MSRHVALVQSWTYMHVTVSKTKSHTQHGHVGCKIHLAIPNNCKIVVTLTISGDIEARLKQELYPSFSNIPWFFLF